MNHYGKRKGMKQPLQEEITLVIRNEKRSMCLPENLIEAYPWCADIKCTNRPSNNKENGMWEISYSFLKSDVEELKEKSPHLFI